MRWTYLLKAITSLFTLGIMVVAPSTTYNIDTTETNDPGEKYRPQFHYSVEKNWLNDPNGLVYYE